ncbi:MAG: DUF86 domain-containing protein [Bacteroidales bacterium]|nr:DUF86 domain-containing protein [Bacteroidales bacterium]
MREPKNDLTRLEHILEAISYVESYTNGITEEQLKKDKLRLHAIIYNVQIIGEAVYKLSVEFKQQHTETQWAVIEKMRHILVHDYFRINIEVLWDVVSKDILVLKSQIEGYIKDI